MSQMNETIQKIILENSSNLSNITNIANYTSSIINNSSRSGMNSSNISTVISKVDPNWFYSASAQSAAAIVGLMGAFITTKLINHNSFFTQLKQEINEYQKKINHINGEITTKRIYIDQFEHEMKEKLVDNFLDMIAFEVNPNSPFTLDEVYHMSQTGFEYGTYKDIEKSILAEKYNDDYLDGVRHIGDNVFESPTNDNNDEQIKYQKYQKYKEDITEKKAEVAFYTNLLMDKKRIRSSESQEIMSIRDYLSILFLFSLVGIFLPLFMMLWSYETMMHFRTITYIAIFLGWAIILGQLYFSVVNLLKIKD